MRFLVCALFLGLFSLPAVAEHAVTNQRGQLPVSERSYEPKLLSVQFSVSLPYRLGENASTRQMREYGNALDDKREAVLRKLESRGGVLSVLSRDSIPPLVTVTYFSPSTEAEALANSLGSVQPYSLTPPKNLPLSKEVRQLYVEPHRLPARAAIVLNKGNTDAVESLIRRYYELEMFTAKGEPVVWPKPQKTDVQGEHHVRVRKFVRSLVNHYVKLGYIPVNLNSQADLYRLKSQWMGEDEVAAIRSIKRIP